MKNCLIMITSSYPFLTQEAFLESELSRIQSGFDKIITLAIDIGKDVTEKRAVPSNADCYNVAVQSKTVSRLQSKIIGGINYIKGSDFSDCDMEADTAKRKIFMEYFCARAKKEFAFCMKKLEKYDFTQYERITVYSYWFFVSAMIGTMIKDALKPYCKNIKLVSRAHRYDIYENVNELNYLPMRAYLLEKYDEIYPCSVNGEEHMRKRYPVYAKKINHSYLGTSDCGTARFSNDGFHIVSCSNIKDIKRVDRIVCALELLKDSGINNLKWTHIGDGPDFEKIKNLTEKKLGFMSVTLNGKTSNTNVLNFYRKTPVDLFINVSSSEGLPVSIMEAISFGIPVIATDVGGTSEIVKNNYNGKIIDIDFSNNDLAFEIKKYAFSDEKEKEKMRANARSYWEENFDANKNYAEFLKKIN